MYSTGMHNREKLNYLLKSWPKGTVMTNCWLQGHGISRSLRQKYEKSKWVESIGQAIIRFGESISWEGGLYAIQHQLKKQIHIGGKTALEKQGLGHFVQFQEMNAYLFGPPDEKLPSWFQLYNWGPKIHYIQSSFLPMNIGIENEKMGEFSLAISSPERAILEILYLVPQKQSFEESRLLMENLARLRPAIIQELLEACKSIKVKRLCLYMAEYLGHTWLEDLDLTKINLGHGKRSIVKNGYLNYKYQITVPYHDK